MNRPDPLSLAHLLAHDVQNRFRHFAHVVMSLSSVGKASMQIGHRLSTLVSSPATWIVLFVTFILNVLLIGDRRSRCNWRVVCEGCWKRQRWRLRRPCFYIKDEQYPLMLNDKGIVNPLYFFHVRTMALYTRRSAIWWRMIKGNAVSLPFVWNNSFGSPEDYGASISLIQCSSSSKFIYPDLSRRICRLQLLGSILVFYIHVPFHARILCLVKACDVPFCFKVPIFWLSLTNSFWEEPVFSNPEIAR